MLNPKYFQDAAQELEQGLKKKNVAAEMISRIGELARRRKELIQQTEALKSERNRVTQEISQLKSRSKTDPIAAEEGQKKVLEMRAVGERIWILDEELKSVEQAFQDESYRIPNLPDASVPEGAGAEQNLEIRKCGEIRALSFEPRDHVDLGEKLGILDFEKAGKISGARFALYMKQGAALERALIQFMLDLHTREHGYEEVIPPFLVNRASMTGTGQLPKFEEDLFKTGVGERELFLIPTSEVPLTNIYRDEIIEHGKLPIYFTAYSPCFRSEAGAYGKDTRGLIRQHQFQKVELVKFVEPENSFDELEKMTLNAEKVLQLLGLPYRTMLLCGGDMGFSAAKTYDIEVWMPAQKTYREISSCSNCTDFQSRRASIRYREEAQGKPKLVHTLNGSGLAVGRTFVAILENFQDAQGNVEIPQVLNKYLDGAPGFTKEGQTLWIKAK